MTMPRISAIKSQKNHVDRFNAQQLFDHALRFLSFRPRSRQEIRKFLQKKLGQSLSQAVGEQLIDQALERLAKAGLIDDGQFAKLWVESRLRHRPRSASFLRHELLAKGIEASTADQIITNLVGDEQKLAEAAVVKKIELWKKLDQRQSQLKMASFLRGRGFSWEVIRQVIDRLLGHQV